MADIIDVNIGETTLEVYWQDEVELNLDMSLMYIKSGEKEIENYVENVSKPEIDNYIETEAKPIVAEVVVQIAEPTVKQYLDETVKPSIDEYVDGKKPELQEYVTQAEGYADNSKTYSEESAASAAAALVSANNSAQSATNSENYANQSEASAGLAANSAAEASNSEEKAAEYLQQIGNKITTVEGSIGDIGFAPLGINETENKRRYLNGQVISQSQFVSFTNKIKSAIELYPNLATSETNWQAEVTNSPYGICGKFVIDDTLGTIRLPKYPDWSIREVGQASVIGNGMSLGLTDGNNNNYGLCGANVGEYGARLSAYKSKYGTSLPNTISNSTAITNQTAYGLTKDATKSGVIADLVNANTEDKLQGKWFIQVATGVEESVDVTREIELNNPFSLLDYKWSEYEITNASWLLSNGAFHSGATYKAVYELLLKIYNGTETKDGVSVKLSTEAYTDTDFVINTANTTFRLPIKVKLASGNAVVGNGRAVGLTSDGINVGTLSGSDSVGIYANGTNPPPVLPTGRLGDANLESGRIGYGITTDPTKSGIETSSSGLKLYFYVGETIQDANVIAASQVLTKVANSIDRTVKSDRATVVGWGMPDYSAGVVKTLNVEYTAEVDGMLLIQTTSSTSGRQLKIDNVTISMISNAGATSLYTMPFVGKGSVYKLTGTSGVYEFYPLKGVN